MEMQRGNPSLINNPSMFQSKVTHASLEKHDGQVAMVEHEGTTDTTITVRSKPLVNTRSDF